SAPPISLSSFRTVRWWAVGGRSRARRRHVGRPGVGASVVWPPHESGFRSAFEALARVPFRSGAGWRRWFDLFGYINSKEINNG
ncbi:hypothetical protein, partial [Escherichia coli]|uniref:hypothetical protein n=1 Tax=Escherichia coli TaxID=562 RepID=UPI002283F561